MMGRAGIQLVLVLAIAVTPCLAVCGKDAQARSPAASRTAIVKSGIVSPSLMSTLRFKGHDQPWGLGPAVHRGAPAPGVSTFALATTAALAPPAALRLLGRAPAGSRPPPRL
jgi:hypothetical protein